MSFDSSDGKDRLRRTLLACVREAGTLLLRHFGKIKRVTRKENPASIVTEADLAAEQLITDRIQRDHPDHNLLAEESGLDDRGSDITWVIDPLDGTSNFAAGLPWFGVMVAVLEQSQPVLASMYLPVDEVLFVAGRGEGVTRNGHAVQMNQARDLSDVLVACAMDPTNDPARRGKAIALMSLLVNRARNIRLTNCLLDFCYTLDGRLGAVLNHNCKVWDIAPACLMFPEAGGCFTDLKGSPITLDLHPARYLREYAIAGGPSVLHRQLLDVATEAGF